MAEKKGKGNFPRKMYISFSTEDEWKAYDRYTDKRNKEQYPTLNAFNCAVLLEAVKGNPKLDSAIKDHGDTLIETIRLAQELQKKNKEMKKSLDAAIESQGDEIFERRVQAEVTKRLEAMMNRVKS